jgi:IclR family transcriptional regulator, KDG regulon repressor
MDTCECQQTHAERSAVPADRVNSDRAALYQVKVFDKFMDILDAFSVRRRELSVREIMESTGLNRPTTTRLVANLERRGLLQQAPTAGRYRLGQRLFELGSIVRASFSVVQAAAQPLSQLELRSGATIVLAVRNDEYSVILDRRQGVGDGGAMVPMPVEVGNVRPLTYGLIGQVFLASLAPDIVHDLLQRYPLQRHTPYSTMDPEHFLERLESIRRHGYGMEVNEAVEGLMGVAAPILDFAGNTVGVLSLGFPATRENDEAFMEAAVGNLVLAAADVSANMGYSRQSEHADDPAEEAGATEPNA